MHATGSTYRAFALRVITVNQEKNVMESLKISKVTKDFYSELSVNEASLKTYERVMNQFIKWLFVNKIEFNQVKKADIINYKRQLNKVLGVKTTNLYISVVRRFYEWLEDNSLYTNVARGIKQDKILHEYRRMPLTKDQVTKLLDSVDMSTNKGKRDYAMLYLMIMTGLRRVEVQRLNVGDLIEINGGYALRVQRKGFKTKDQYKGLSSDLFYAIQDFICTRKEFDDSKPLFNSCGYGRDNRLTVDSISKTVKKYLFNIGLNSSLYSAHSLRHTTATTLLNEGYDIYYVQVYMGHSSPATTELYTKSFGDKLTKDDSGIKSLEKAFEIKKRGCKH
jgi:integrase/recombinase XerC/integrase/recombinase XerD